MVSYTAGPDDVGLRVDLVIARETGATRTLVQRALKAGSVTVAGEQVRASHRLELGQQIQGDLPEAIFSPPEAEDIGIEVRYSDDRLLVVSKPPGLVTHPARGHETGTLVNALLNLGEPLSGIGSTRPGIVHRLDKDTSGLLLVARDDAAHEYLVAALQRREIERTYLALVRGKPPAESGTIEAPVGRHPVKRRKMAVTPGGRAAVTHYRVLGSAQGAALLEVKLETGRTHQIRVHMAHLDHPVLGDRAYGGWSDRMAELGLTRPFLHAVRLGFPHPDDGRMIEVTDPLPQDLREVLEKLGLELYP
ncbi:MAG: rRNA synthase [Actinomycetota bacterium]|jgi:23S rRNA pseudouridine1911/1915/1917 synthase|nr:rRNA synthase [Actinomycetota bacterium]